MSELTVTKDIFKLTVPTPFPVGDVNLYLVKGDVLTLVDAGVKTEESWQLFKNQLAEIGYSPSDIEQVVITHHHPDHVGMLDFFNEDVPIIGHPRNQPWISQDHQFFEQHAAFFQSLFIELGIDPMYFKAVLNMRHSLKYSCHRSLTSEIVEGGTIFGLPEWQVFETPGHAQSHIVLYREKDGLVIGGDTILAKISPNPLIEPPNSGEKVRPKSQLQYNDSLKKLQTMDIAKVVTGHGDDVFDTHNLIVKRLTKQKERAYGVLAMLRGKPMTAFEVCKLLFPAVYKKEIVLTVSETLAQLDFLEDLGEIKVDNSKPQFIYYV